MERGVGHPIPIYHSSLRAAKSTSRPILTAAWADIYTILNKQDKKVYETLCCASDEKKTKTQDEHMQTELRIRNRAGNFSQSLQPKQESYAPPVYLILSGGSHQYKRNQFSKFRTHCQYLMFGVWAVVTAIALVRLGIADALARRGSETRAYSRCLFKLQTSVFHFPTRCAAWLADTCYVCSRAHLRSNVCTSARRA